MSLGHRMDNYPVVNAAGVDAGKSRQDAIGITDGYMDTFDSITPSLHEIAATDGDFPTEISAMNVAFAAIMQRKGMPVDHARFPFSSYPRIAFRDGNIPRPLQPYWMVMQMQNLAGQNLTSLTLKLGRQYGGRETKLIGEEALAYKPVTHAGSYGDSPTPDFKDSALAIVPGGKLVRLSRAKNGRMNSDNFPLSKMTWHVLPAPVDMSSFYGSQETPAPEVFIEQWSGLLVKAIGRYVEKAKNELHVDGVIDVNRAADYYRNRSRWEW